jgi:hypothetical protein
MAINMSRALYLACQNVFGRPGIFTYAAGGTFTGSGIYSSTEMELMLDDGAVISDQRTIFDIRAEDYPTLPAQNDTVTIPAEPISGLPALGDFQITNVWHNGGGEVTLQLRQLETKS